MSVGRIDGPAGPDRLDHLRRSRRRVPRRPARGRPGPPRPNLAVAELQQRAADVAAPVRRRPRARARRRERASRAPRAATASWPPSPTSASRGSVRGPRARASSTSSGATYGGFETTRSNGPFAPAEEVAVHELDPSVQGRARRFSSATASASAETSVATIRDVGPLVRDRERDRARSRRRRRARAEPRRRGAARGSARRRSRSPAAGSGRADRRRASAAGSPTRRGRRRAARARPAARRARGTGRARSGERSGSRDVAAHFGGIRARARAATRRRRRGEGHSARSSEAAPSARASRTVTPRGFERPAPFLGAQRLGELVELAVEHRVEPVRGQLDPVVGDAVLREVVGADLLRPLAAADLRPPGALELGALLRRARARRAARAGRASPSRGSGAGTSRPASRRPDPVGRWVIRTAESVVLTLCPPGPVER